MYSFRNDKQSCKNFFKNYQAIVSLYTKNIREYSIAIFEKGHRWKPNFWPNWYPGGSKLSKKSTFKFIAKCMGHEASSGTCVFQVPKSDTLHYFTYKWQTRVGKFPEFVVPVLVPEIRGFSGTNLEIPRIHFTLPAPSLSPTWSRICPRPVPVPELRGGDGDPRGAGPQVSTLHVTL